MNKRILALIIICTVFVFIVYCKDTNTPSKLDNSTYYFTNNEFNRVLTNKIEFLEQEDLCVIQPGNWCQIGRATLINVTQEQWKLITNSWGIGTNRLVILERPK